MTTRPGLPTGPLSRRSALAGGAGLLGLGLAACSGASGAGRSDTIRIGVIPTWSDTVVIGHVLQNRLQALGHSVEIETLGNAAVLFAALAGGDIDIIPSARPEITHAAHLEEYGPDVEDLGIYHRRGVNMLCVPEYTPVDSIEELAAAAGRFDGQITGIGAGAGLSRVVTQQVMPAYGLDRALELATSSVPAMLSELDTAVAGQDDLVVTMWRPFWAYRDYPLKELADPDGAFGGPEALHVLGRRGFAGDLPEAAGVIDALALEDGQYRSLERTVRNEYGDGREAEGVRSWMDRNPGVLPEVAA